MCEAWGRIRISIKTMPIHNTALSQINVDVVLVFSHTHLQQHLRAGQAVAAVQDAAARQRGLTQS